MRSKYEIPLDVIGLILVIINWPKSKQTKQKEERKIGTM